MTRAKLGALGLELTKQVSREAFPENRIWVPEANQSIQNHASEVGGKPRSWAKQVGTRANYLQQAITSLAFIFFYFYFFTNGSFCLI